MLILSIVLCVAVFIILASAILYFGYRHYVSPARVYQRLGDGVMAAPSGVVTEPAGPGLAVNILQSIGELVPASPADVSLVRKDLIAAGYRSDVAIKVFIGIRILLCTFLVLVAIVLRALVTQSTLLGIVMIGVAAFLGYMGPSFILEHLVSLRQEKLRFSLPDALDLMVVCVEAGLGLDQTIQHVTRELAIAHPELCDELGLVSLEIRAGKRRMEALKNLGERTAEPEIRKLVATLVQTERFGTGIAEALRVHSDFLRARRKLEAEERAGKVGVKLVFPIFFLIMPAMLVVAAGPGLIQVFKYLFPLMRSFRQL